MNRAATPNKPISKINLIERVNAGDTGAWDQFSKLYGPLVYRWIRKSGVQDNDAADVMQGVFRNLAVGIGQFRKNKSNHSFRSWLFMITRDAVKQFGESGQGHHAQLKQVESLAELDDESFNIDASLTHRSLHLIRNEFEDKTWRAFWRSVVEGQSAVDIAQQLGMEPQAVRQAKYRVLCRVQELLSDE